MPKDSLHNEKELLRLVANGDQQAYQQVFDGYWDQIFAFCLRVTKSPEQSKDLAQDIFLKLWDVRENLPAVRNFRAYLYAITRNLIHDKLRTQIFRDSNKEFLLAHFARSEKSQLELLEQKEQREHLQDAILQLPPQLHKVFTLSHFEGLSHSEIAQRLQITPMSSRTYMVRALLFLRKKITSFLW